MIESPPSFESPLPHKNNLPPYSSDKRTLLIVIPAFNDWQALEKLLALIDEISLPQDISLKVVIVDDYSTEVIPPSFLEAKFNQIKQVNVLRLQRNLGHQRAITIGLCYVYHNFDCNFIVVMDGDGEDNPFEIENLFNLSEQTGNDKIIFAKRSKRSETKIFKAFYFLYQKLYLLLIGKEIRVGNFSLIPHSLLKNVVVISEIWNHYSSGLRRSRIPYLEVNVPRAKRLDGQPKMNLVSLITHGLSSIAVYGDVVGTRILLFIAFLLGLLFLIFCIVFIVKMFTNFAIPGWATYVTGLLLISGLQLILIGMVFSLTILAARNNNNFIPVRDYTYYVDYCRSLKS